MHLLRKIFFLERIYFKKTLRAVAIDYFLILVLAYAVNAFFHQTLAKYPWILGLFCAVYAYFLVRTLLRNLIVNLRIKKSAFVPLFPASKEYFQTSIESELESIDGARQIIKSTNAKVYDAIFNFYRQTKHGSYLGKQAYYTVCEVQLDRELPHILFDSRHAKGRQFRYQYLQVQKISVQGNFDIHFDTYVPQTYHIDSLSFVSPEVMEALMWAKKYDVEIVGSKLFIFAPLIDTHEAQKLMDLGLEIAKRINDNIDTYRDNRLSGAKRATEVTPFARGLLKSPVKYVITLVITGLLMGVIFYAALYFDGYEKDVLLNQYSVVVYLVFITNTWRVIKIKRTNDKLTKEFLQKQIKDSEITTHNRDGTIK